MTLNARTKEAIKTALAMTIAYGIALSMDWDRPYWAGFAVAFISLSTVGQSLNKGALRMLGTLVAFVASLTIIALFAQERWWFMVALSAWVGYCTYMNGGTRHQYFWFVAGFASVIICFDGGTNPANAFDTAVLRAQETGLGILVYTIVTILLWPSSTRGELDSAVRELGSHPARDLPPLSQAARRPGDGGGQPQLADAGGAAVHPIQSGPGGSPDGQLPGVGGAPAMAAGPRPIEGGDGNPGALARELRRGQGSRSRSSASDPGSLRRGTGPPLRADRAHARRQASRGHPAGSSTCRWTRSAERVLSHFQKAALAVTRARLQHLDEITRSLFETLADIKGFATSSPQPPAADAPGFGSVSGFVLDPDRLAATVRAMASLWLGLSPLDLHRGPRRRRYRHGDGLDRDDPGLHAADAGLQVVQAGRHRHRLRECPCTSSSCRSCRASSVWDR